VSGQPQAWDGMQFEEPELVGGPRFCPRCGREAGRHATLCDHCGEALRAQGYCAVCERFWRRPAGSDCPKHDIPLDDAPVAPVHDEAARAPWVLLHIFPDTQAAEAPRLRLEAEGIPTFLEGSRMGSRSMYHIATGGVRLHVPEPLLADARILLAQSWALPIADDLDDAWENLGPEPGAGRRSFLEGLIVLLFLGPLVLVPLLLWLIGWLLGLNVRPIPAPRRG
jgi:hypothetical protein